MADIAAKREARRRKILENSEYRLQRITGRTNNDEATDEGNKKTVEAQSTTSSTNSNGILANEPMMQNQTFDSLINEINANIDADEPSNKSSYAAQQCVEQEMLVNDFFHRRNPERHYVSHEYENTESFDVNTSNNLRFPPDRQDHHVGSLLDYSRTDVPTENSATPEKPSLLINVLSSRLVYVILAIVVNIMVFLKLEHLFGTTIIVPFFTVMIGRLCTFKNDNTSESNNMLLAALILSNCKPNFFKFMQRLKGTFSLFRKIFSDLSVYIFTFVLLYNVLSCYKNDTDISSFKIDDEAIFSDNVAM